MGEGKEGTPLLPCIPPSKSTQRLRKERVAQQRIWMQATERWGEQIQCWCQFFFLWSSHSALCLVSTTTHPAIQHHHHQSTHPSLKSLDSWCNPTPVSQGLLNTCLTHDHLVGRDIVVYFLGCSDMFKVTVANSFYMVIFQPWLTQGQFCEQT